jgi:hypothetical protein
MNRRVAAPMLRHSSPPAMTLSGRDIELGAAQQSVDQPYQLPGSECHGSFVMMFDSFIVLDLIVGPKLRLEHPHRVGPFHQVVPEVTLVQIKFPS